MLTLAARSLQQLRTVAKRFFNLRGSQTGLPLLLNSGPAGLSLRICQQQWLVEYRLLGRFPALQLAIPLDELGQMLDSHRGEVTLQLEAGQAEVCWEQHRVPRRQRLTTLPFPAEPLPAAPPRWAPQPEHFRQALADAAATTADESNRYALNCLLLKGATGEVLATDAVQLLVQSGFEFPFEDDRLIPATRVFSSGKELGSDRPLEVGAGPEHVAFRSGDWTFWTPVQTEARFPNVERLLRRGETPACQVQLSETDAEFLRETLPGLPADDQPNLPVTLDTGDCIRVRGRGEDRSVTEVALNDSTRSGQALQISSNRRLLERALSLGFREFHLQSQDSPLICQDQRRVYLWAALSKDSIIPPADQAVRIESPASRSPARPARSVSTLAPARNVAPATKPVAAAVTRTVPPAAAEAEPQTLDELLRQADGLRETLKSALDGFRRLSAGLRQHRRRTRQLQQTLRSLRELQTSEV